MLTAIIVLTGMQNIAYSAIKHNITNDKDYIAITEQDCKNAKAMNLMKGLMEEGGCTLACNGDAICIGRCHSKVKEAYNELPECKCKECPQLPHGYNKDDLRIALQTAKEFRIKQRLLLKCSEFQPALQPSLEAAGKCWNPNCSELIDNDVRAEGNCPPLGEKVVRLTAGPNARNIIKRLHRRGYRCFEDPESFRDYRCIKQKAKKAKTPNLPPSGSKL